MAQVYLARDVRLGREVAVKVLDRRLAERPGFRERFLREARVAAALDHPNIVPLYDFGESGMLYLVMPYVSGGSLQDILRRAPLQPSEVATFGSQIADALDYAHQRHVVHRDVKPANMLVHADGRLMLSDFGLAKILDSSARPAAPRRHPDAGTPEYMAPEQIEGRTEPRSDIYGLGVVLYLLLTGHLPFTGSSAHAVMEGHLYRAPVPPRQVSPKVTPAMEQVVLRALAKNPEDRYARASEMGAALLSALIAGDAEPLPFGSSPSIASLPPISSSSVSVPLIPPYGAGSIGPGSRVTGHPRSFSTGVLPRLDIPLTAPQPPNSQTMHSQASRGSMAGQLSAGGYSFAPSQAHSQGGQMESMPGAFQPPSISPGTSGGVPSAPGRLTGTLRTLPPRLSVPERPSQASSGPFLSDTNASQRGSASRTASEDRAEDARAEAEGQRMWIILTALLLITLFVAGLLLHWVQTSPNGILQ